MTRALIMISIEVDVIKQCKVGIVSNILEVREFNNVRINHVTLTDNLENQV